MCNCLILKKLLNMPPLRLRIQKLRGSTPREIEKSVEHLFLLYRQGLVNNPKCFFPAWFLIYLNILAGKYL